VSNECPGIGRRMNAGNQQAQQVFAEAREVADLAARQAYLGQACAGAPALREEVESLLAAEEQAGQFMHTEAVPTALSLPTEKCGDRIGRYKLLEQIGEGGFGVVWMAEQEEPVRRRVALKIVKLGMDTKEVVARFEAERQALAMMDHPNIATVFDGGATATGRPYFVMELVKGVPITEYCDANKLPTRERLDLFIQVCQAVQHAHHKGVIHRDLKPSNILVTVKDDRPLPKVIDFGVAKATQAVLTGKTVFTRLNQCIGTPAYMSPEQAGLGSLDVDTRSDLYALGVLLYELLTGRTPFDTGKLLAAGYDAVMRMIREEEPPKPSTRLSTLAEEELNAVAAKRQADPAKLNRLVRGDLDWIVMKALEKDRARRYESANSLAQDVDRHLRQEPVSAAAPTLFYRAGKFARRNRTRLAFATLAGVVGLLAVAGVKFAWSSKLDLEALRSTDTNAIFTVARSGEAKALARLLDGKPGLVNERDADGSTPLSWAAGAGATNTLRCLVARGANVEATNRAGLTALDNAAGNHQPAAVIMLLEAGADPNHADAQGVAPLHAASLYGSVEMGRALIAKGARLDAVSLATHVTALHQAAMLGYADFVELLLAKGARPDVRDSTGNTPLHAAATGKTAVGNIRESLEQLRSRATSSRDNQGLAGPIQDASNHLARMESIMLAPTVQHAGGQHRRVAELLLARQADLETTNSEWATPLLMAAFFTNLPVAEVLVAHKANLEAHAKDGSTPLNLVALKDSVPMAELLLKAGAQRDSPDHEGFTPLNSAIEQNHTDVAKLLLARGANPNLPTRSGQTPMHTAAGYGNVEMLRLLHDHGAALHPLQNAGTPLSLAVQYGQIEAVKFILQLGAKSDVAPPQNSMTSLDWAAALGRPDMVKLLLAAGATADPGAPGPVTPLHFAAGGRAGATKMTAGLYAQFPANTKLRHLDLGSDADYLAVLRVLVDAKANVNVCDTRDHRTPLYTAVNQGQVAAVDALVAAGADLKVQDRIGQTPLHAVCELEAPAEVVSNIVMRLLQAGADQEARDQFRGTPLHAAANAGKPVMAALLLEAGARANPIGPMNCTPLQLAVQRGRRDVVELLLRRNPDLDWRNDYGTTALQQAVQLQAKEIVELLLKRGADPDFGSTNGGTALMIAAHNGDPDTIRLLTAHGSKVNKMNAQGWCAFLEAAYAGKVDAARLLLEKDARFEVTDVNDVTPLIAAAKGGGLEMVKFLRGHGAALDAKNNVGFTALHEAADRGHAEVVQYLLDQGVEVDPTCTFYHSTPLHCAAAGAFTNESFYVPVVKLLLKHGANPNARSSRDMTPLHRAVELGHPRLVELLLAAQADPRLCDGSGRTPLDIATDKTGPRLLPEVATGRKECSEILRKAVTETRKEAKP